MFLVSSGSSPTLLVSDPSVGALIFARLCHITIKHKFHNTSDVPLEARIGFGLDFLRGGAIATLTVDDGTRTLTAVVKGKKNAQEEYADALARGSSAYLLQRRENTPEAHFDVSLGLMRPHSSLIVTIAAVMELEEDSKDEDGSLVSRAKFSLPCRTIFGPGLQSPLLVNLFVWAPVPVKNVFSPSHKSHVANLVAPGQSVSYTGSIPASDLDRDLVFLIESARPNESLALLQTDDSAAAGDRTTLSLDLCVPASLYPTRPPPPEVVFVVDRSGSMAGAKLTALKQALTLCLHSLPPGCHFGLMAFARDCVSPFQAISVPYSNSSLALAMDFVDQLRADGGTSLTAPLQRISSTTAPSCGRGVLIITDGEVEDTSATLRTIAEIARAGTRVFSMGIGAGASRVLVRGLASRGGGESVFVDSWNAGEVEEYSARALQLVLAPPILVCVRSAGADLISTPVTAATDTRCSVQLSLPAPVPSVDIVVRAPGATLPLGSFSVEATPLPASALPGLARKIAAAKQIDVLLRTSDPASDRAAISLSTAHGLLCSLTSFVLVAPAGSEALLSSPALAVSDPTAAPRYTHAMPHPAAPPLLSASLYSCTLDESSFVTGSSRARVKNKGPAPVQMTAGRLLRESATVEIRKADLSGFSCQLLTPQDSRDLSPVRVVPNPDGTLARAAVTQEELGRLRQQARAEYLHDRKARTLAKLEKEMAEENEEQEVDADTMQRREAYRSLFHGSAPRERRGGRQPPKPATGIPRCFLPSAVPGVPPPAALPSLVPPPVNNIVNGEQEKKVLTLTLDSLVRAQQADGSWDASTLQATLSADLDLRPAFDTAVARALAACAESDASLVRKLAATFFALAVLRLRFSAQRSRWSLLARKATLWTESFPDAAKIAPRIHELAVAL